MDAKALVIVVSEPCALAGINVEKYQKMINDSIKEGHQPVSISYLHGKLESKVGYDIGVCLNGENIVIHNQDNNRNKVIEGVYSVKIVDYDNPCTAYLWNDKYDRPRGLIVDDEDAESIKYAIQKYNEKTSWL